MFQRKLEKLEKYLPNFFRDWTITYIYFEAGFVKNLCIFEPQFDKHYAYKKKICTVEIT